MAQYIRYPDFAAGSNASVGLTGSAPPSSATLIGFVDSGGNLASVTLTAGGAIPVSGTITATNPSVGLTGAAVPTSATFVGFRNAGGNLTAVTLDGSGNLPISGTVTANIGTTNGLALDATLSAMSAKLPAALGQTNMAGSMSVVIASNQSAISVSEASVGTTGAAPPASANLAGFVDSGGNLASVTLNAAGALPVNSAQLPSALGQTNMAGSTSVTIASNQSAIAVTTGSLDAVTFVRNDYSGTAVTTGTYLQLIASTASAIKELQVFDSSGQTMALAFGAAASEVNQILIFPGGNGNVPLRIPAGTRVSLIAISATANVGEIDINFFG